MTLDKVQPDKHCNARTRGGTYCRQTAGWGTSHPGSGRCKLHGGASPGGVAASRFKTGRYSRFLPARMAANYEQALSDPALLEMGDEIALVDAHLAELLAELDRGESGTLWADTAAAWDVFTTAVKSRDRRRQADAINELDRLITAGQKERAAWADITAVLETRRRLVESERRRLVDLNQYLTNQQAMVMIAALTSIIKEHVTDKDTLRAISADIVRIADWPAR